LSIGFTNSTGAKTENLPFLPSSSRENRSEADILNNCVRPEGDLEGRISKAHIGVPMIALNCRLQEFLRFPFGHDKLEPYFKNIVTLQEFSSQGDSSLYFSDGACSGG